MAISAWTLQNYQDRVVGLCKTQDDLVAAADVTIWVNACLGILQPWAYVEAASTTLTPDSGSTDTYTPPSALYEPIWVAENDDQDTQLNFLPDWDRTSTGIRTWNGKWILQPDPGSSTTLHLEYYAKLTNLSASGDSPTFDAEWHDLPFLFACMRAKEQDDEFGEGQDFKVQWEARFKAFKGRRRPGKGERGVMKPKLKW